MYMALRIQSDPYYQHSCQEQAKNNLLPNTG